MLQTNEENAFEPGPCLEPTKKQCFWIGAWLETNDKHGFKPEPCLTQAGAARSHESPDGNRKLEIQKRAEQSKPESETRNWNAGWSWIIAREPRRKIEIAI